LAKALAPFMSENGWEAASKNLALGAWLGFHQAREKAVIYEGYSGSVEVTEQGLTVRHSKFIGGGKEPCFIPFSDIASVHLKPANVLTNGNIQFRAHGEKISGPVAIQSDPRSIIIRAGQNDRFEELRSFLLGIIQKRLHPPASNFSIAEELAKLNRLRTSGILTDEEFEAQKAKLLRN
jgi:hypothetical protein